MVLDRLRKPRLLRAMLFIALTAFVTPVCADELERIVAVAKGGATDLALTLLAKHQPPPTHSQEWIRWETERLTILAQTQQWKEIAARVEALPYYLPSPFVHWALVQAAEAQLAAEDGAAARRYLRRLIWKATPEPEQLAQWRRLVIRSYLLDNNVADAHAALLRYKQDYRADNEAWKLLHAKVLLRAGHNKAAFDVLQDTQSLEGKTLRTLAGMRSGIYKAPAAKAQGLKLTEATQGKPELQQKAWALVAEAAARANDDVYRVIGLEQAITLLGDGKPSERIYKVSADELWQAYEWLAESLGNRLHLLVGNDQPWLEQAHYFESEEKAYARSLYAFLSRRGALAATREEGHKGLTASLMANGAAPVVQWLYTRSKRFGSLDAIPASVRYQLADMALKRRDVHFAARLLQGLERAPEGEDPDQWALRRARISIYAGDFKRGAVFLSQILDNKRALNPEFADRYLQVLFDLQAVNRHAEAYVLLDSVYALVEEPRQQREILYWMADSRNALGEYQGAAELYLRSAHYRGAPGKDPWGHSARYQAAEALAKAGLITDARGVYRQLLDETADQRRRAVIERQLQQLWLREQQHTTQ